MKIPASVCLLALALAPCAGAAPATAFVDVTVLPMDGERVLRNQTVLVEGDRIVAIGPTAAVALPAAATKIDGRGKFLLPGLAEMHGHNPPPGSSPQYIEDIYFLFLANGVTTVRSMLGWPGQLELRDRVRRGELLGPTLHLAGPSFSGQSTPGPDVAERRVREQQAEGWDLLKVHPGLRRDTYDAMAATAKEVGIAFAGHIPAEVGLLHAIEQGQLTIDHLDGYIEHLKGDAGPLDAAQLVDAVRRTREAGIAVVPTMALWEAILGAAEPAEIFALPELKYLPRTLVEQWKAGYERRRSAPNFNAATARRIAANRPVLLKALADGGVPILFGTDAPQIFSVPGFSVHREAAAMEAAGMSRPAILRSATAAVGEHGRAWDDFGTVRVGARADLLLLGANPLDDLAALARRSGVMVRGRWLPEEEIQRGLAAIAERNARP